MHEGIFKNTRGLEGFGDPKTLIRQVRFANNGIFIEKVTYNAKCELSQETPSSYQLEQTESKAC